LLVTGLVVIAIVGLLVFLLVSNADTLPRTFLSFLGYLFLSVSFIELVLLFWILITIWISPWTLWSLSFSDFWREQLPAFYFIKVCLYAWLWNDLLNLMFVFLPAVVFLSIRTTFTTVIGFWALSAARRPRPHEPFYSEQESRS